MESEQSRQRKADGVSEHALVVERSGENFHAVCACGWTSLALTEERAKDTPCDVAITKAEGQMNFNAMRRRQRQAGQEPA